MASAGIIPGIITCVFSGGIASFGLYLLSLCATKTPHRQASFFVIAQITYPKAAVFFDAAIAIKCFGVAIRCVWYIQYSTSSNAVHLHSYLIVIKSLIPNVVSSLFRDSEPPAWMLDGGNWLVIFMAILIPLGFLRRLDSLRYTSYAALFSVGTLSYPLNVVPLNLSVHFIQYIFS